jgi:peptide methionine sulfoxide reductase msrA/msrB
MNWKDVLQLTKNNPAPPRRVEKTGDEWKSLLTPEQYRVTRQHATERAFSGEYCEIYTPGIYSCVCCGTQLFDSTGKFNSGTGWPSFSEPVKNDVIRYEWDYGYGMKNIEVLCNPDGPQPTGLRYCINSLSLKKEDSIAKDEELFETATFGGGCFWCIEAVFNELDGVEEVSSGYAGGKTENPTYWQVSNGNTGHAEVVQVRFNPNKISYADMLRIFFATHDPSSLNRQGADIGSEYRSIILYHYEAQRQIAGKIIGELQSYYDAPIVTEVVAFTKFYKAEQKHQDYYRNNPENAYCRIVINPKLQKMRAQFVSALKKKTTAAE